MNAIENTADRVVSDLNRLVEACEELLVQTKDAVGAQAGEVRARLTDLVTSAGQTCRRLEKEAAEGVKAADRVVREHPYPSIGVAFGLGLLIGVLAARR